MKQWYTHLVEIESIVVELDKMDLSEDEKLHLAYLIDSSLQHTILSVVFSEVSDEDKRIFVKHLSEDDHGKIWQFLNEKVKGIEIKIKKAADDLKKVLEDDLKEVH